MKFLNKLAKWQLLLFALVIAGIVGFGTAFTYSAMNGSDANTQTACNGTCVSLKAKQAVPNTVTVPVGEYVQFNSADGKTHNLSLGEGGDEHSHTGKFNSGEFKADEAWRVQFNDEGSYLFHDHLNPAISVLVVVYTPDKQYKVE